MWATAILRMVSLSGFLARALHVGTMSDNSVMYAVILFLRRLSISLWFSLETAVLINGVKTIGNQRKHTLQNAPCLGVDVLPFSVSLLATVLHFKEYDVVHFVLKTSPQDEGYTRWVSSSVTYAQKKQMNVAVIKGYFNWPIPLEEVVSEEDEWTTRVKRATPRLRQSK